MLSGLVALAARAGDAVWDHFVAETSFELKADKSPVTAADQAGEAIILAGLAELAPEISVVAEEEAAGGRVPDAANIFFLVDPLDGTKEFIKRGTDFTVNIGLIEIGVPTLGVVYAPARDCIYWGDTVSGQAWSAPRPPHGTIGESRPLAVTPCTVHPRAVASKSHNTPETEAWLAAAGVEERVAIGSSLKFVLIASGEADVYPRPAPTMEWDTAAGDAILRATGGKVFDMDGHTLLYGKPRYFNPGFVATGTYVPQPMRPFLREETP